MSKFCISSRAEMYKMLKNHPSVNFPTASKNSLLTPDFLSLQINMLQIYIQGRNLANNDVVRVGAKLKIVIKIPLFCLL
jgi:hypothetical protein